MRSLFERERDSSVHCETNLKPILASPWNYKGIEGVLENLTTSLRYTLGLIMNHIAFTRDSEGEREDREEAEQYTQMCGGIVHLAYFYALGTSIQFDIP